jgi:hypothetical protein
MAFPKTNRLKFIDIWLEACSLQLAATFRLPHAAISLSSPTNTFSRNHELE